MESGVRVAWFHAVLSLPVSGMTTVCRENASDFARRIGLTDGGHAELDVVVVREPASSEHKPGLAVTFEGSIIGYLSHGFPGSELLVEGSARVSPMLIFAKQGRDWLKFKAWVWCGDGMPEWPFSPSSRPPMNAAEQAKADHERAVSCLELLAADDSDLFASIRAGRARDGAYVSINTLVYEALRDDRLQEALFLAQMALEGLSRRTRPGPVITPTTQLAVRVFKHLKMHSVELAVIEWWMSETGPEELQAAPNLWREAERLRKRGVAPDPYAIMAPER